MVGEFTKCSGCFTIDNGFFFQNFSSVGLAVKLTVSPPVSISIFIPATDTGATCMNTNAPEMDY